MGVASLIGAINSYRESEHLRRTQRRPLPPPDVESLGAR